MNYTEEIIKHNQAISALRKLQEADNLKNAPNIIGRYFRLAHQTYCKVVEISSYAAEDNEADCDVIVVIIETSNSDACIDTSGKYTVRLDVEISKEEFDFAFTKAQAIIAKALRA